MVTLLTRDGNSFICYFLLQARIKAKTLLSRTVFLPKTPQNGIRPVVQNEPSQPQPQQPPPPPPPPPQSQPQNFTQSHPQPFSQSQPQHFTQSQLGGFTVPAAPVFSGQQTFPTYYPPGTIVQTTFINPRQQFFPQEVSYTVSFFHVEYFRIEESVSSVYVIT